MAIVELKHVSVTFQEKKTLQAVNDVSLTVAQGDIFGIIGFSGAGKSTLLRTINVLQLPTKGQVKVNKRLLAQDGHRVVSNTDLRLVRRKIGMIFQNFNLLNEMTVRENIAFGLRHSQLSDQEIEARCDHLLSLVDLEKRKNAYPAELSGGQKQRVAIARALANKPDILISDEATSALDPKNTEQILTLLKELNQKLSLTILLITHEMDVIKKIANKVAVMENGSIIEQGSIRDVFLHPQKALTQKFVGGSSNAIATLNSLNLDQLHADEAIYQLVYSIANVTKSIIVDLYRQVGVKISMLYGNVELLAGEPIGTLVVLVHGGQEKQAATLAFLKKAGVQVIRLNEKGEQL